MRRWLSIAICALLAAPAVCWTASIAAAQIAPTPHRVSPPRPQIRITVPTITPRPLANRPQRVTPKKETKKKTKVEQAAKTPKVPAKVLRTAPLPLARPSGGAANQGQTEPDIVIVALPAGASDAVAAAIAADNNLTLLAQSELPLLNRKIARMQIPDGRAVNDVNATLAGDARLTGVQASFVFLANGDKPKGGNKSGNNALQYSAAKLKLAETRRLADGRAIRIAIIDTGINAEHGAFSAARIQSESVLDGKAVPGDHGTQVAGIIAASGDIIGIAPQAELISIAAFGRTEKGPARSTSYTILRALDRAYNARAQVINMSFAGGADPLMLEALDILADKGIVLVAAAGNEGPKAPPAYPGAHARTIAVTATDARDAVFKRANRGRYVAVAAPGVDVIAPGADGGYLIASGTSFAAPYVSGAAALILQKNPGADAQAVRAILAGTAKDLGPAGHDPDFGAGLIDPMAALYGIERVATPRGPARRTSQ